MAQELTAGSAVVSDDLAQALTAKAQSPEAPLRGAILVLIQFDVCEEIRLDELGKILGARTAPASFKHQAPGYVRYQRPPVEETLEPLILEGGERLEGEIKYYDYGVVSLVFELPFSADWNTLAQLSSRWTSDTNFEGLATRLVNQKLERAAHARANPYPGEWLQEDYFIFPVREIAGSPPARGVVSAHVDHDVQVVRGETA